MKFNKKHMKNYKNYWDFSKTYDNLLKLMTIYENYQKVQRTYQNKIKIK